MLLALSLFFAAFDPLAYARSTLGKIENFEAGVPPVCYTKTGGRSNPCWACHTEGIRPNYRNDAELQREYSFSDFALTNRWTNVFVDRRSKIATISDKDILAWIREDNYDGLRAALQGRQDYPGWVPDLDFEAGFDEEGLARDGSGWRAVRYKPFVGTFWPTNGSTDDVFIRLPAQFRKTRADYLRNLEIVEQAIARVGATLPANYVAGAAAVPVRRFVYPTGTEFLHSVRYVDPDAQTFMSRRMKELRYSHKVEELTDEGYQRRYDKELEEKVQGRVPSYRGNALTGVIGPTGWQYQGFIEDQQGRLRVQTDEEHRYCMGCHSSIGITIDASFAFPRKLPGAEGWRPQDLRGQKDVPQKGHAEPEILTYLRRVLGGDELRANTEMLSRFFPRGRLDSKAVQRAAPGGDKDLLWLLAPSRARALTLDKAYRVLVEEQSFARGRDAVASPPGNVHRKIENGSTELGKTKRTFTDGRLLLAWPREPNP
jgi:hypothetical protein